MSDNKAGIILSYLGELDTLLKRGDMAYKNYLSNGKNYLYAKILKENNQQIRDVIISKNHLLPEVQMLNALELLAHIDVWIVLWDELDNSKLHDNSEEFVFKNTVNFPKKSVASLYEFYTNLAR